VGPDNCPQPPDWRMRWWCKVSPALTKWPAEHQRLQPKLIAKCSVLFRATFASPKRLRHRETPVNLTVSRPGTACLIFDAAWSKDGGGSCA